MIPEVLSQLVATSSASFAAHEFLKKILGRYFEDREVQVEAPGSM